MVQDTHPVSGDALDPGKLASALWRDEHEHAIVLLDLTGRIVGWHGAAPQVFGYTAEQVIGRPVDELFLPVDRSRGQPRAELDAARLTGHAEDDRWHLRRDGAAVWVNGSVSLLQDEHGTPIGFAKLMRDRTDLRTQIEVLEARHAGLQQRLDAAGLLLRSVGHELRNALGPMANVATLMERMGADEASHVRAGILRRQVAVMERLAADLMDFTRSESGRLELRIGRVSLQDLLRDAVADEAQAASERGVRLELVLPEAPIVVLADRARLQQVVLNLIDNALRHNGSGHRIVVRALEQPPDALIRIEDDGVGNPADLLPRIFDLFARGTATPSHRQGLGIGLALSKTIVELHGGSIEARSGGQNQGASFSVRLPLPPADGGHGARDGDRTRTPPLG